jgi:hypothetical protein
MRQFVVHLGGLPYLVLPAKVAFEIFLDPRIELHQIARVQFEISEGADEIEPEMVADARASGVVDVFQKELQKIRKRLGTADANAQPLAARFIGARFSGAPLAAPRAYPPREGVD